MTTTAPHRRNEKCPQRVAADAGGSIAETNSFVASHSHFRYRSRPRRRLQQGRELKMAEDILHDIARIRRLVAEASKEHDTGKDIGSKLASISDELSHLLEKAEARLESMEREGLDERTRFVSDLAGSFLRSMMEQRGGGLTGSEVSQAVDMADEIVKHVKARF